MSFDVSRVRADFPILSRQVNGRPLVYLDSGASAQKPQVVIDAISAAYAGEYANVHRGLHFLSNLATDNYERVRAIIARFLNAPHEDEVIFTTGTTEAINLVAYALSNAAVAKDPAYRRYAVGQGDEIVVTEMEHHANLVPWQQLCERTGATLRWLGLTDDGRLDLADLATVVNERTKLVAVTQQSNILGTINPLEEIVARAREVGALVLVDGAQSVPHQPVDVTELGADFLVFSGHKMLGPTGIGVLWGRYEVLDALPPFLTGGSMIEVVRMEGSTFAAPPQRFEAGVPMTAQAIGLAAAVEYLQALGMDRVEEHEKVLTGYALEKLAEIPGVTVIGPPDTVARGGAVSFTVEGIHPHDVGQVLDDAGIAVRVGHHCAWPVVRRYGVPATTRATFYVHTGYDDIDALADGIRAAQKFFGTV